MRYAPRSAHTRVARRRWWATLVAALALVLAAALPSAAAAHRHGHHHHDHGLNGFHQRNLVADRPGFAEVPDPNLVNAWGLAFGPATPAWVADNGTDVSTLYRGATDATPAPSIVPLVVSLPQGAPTGAVFNGGDGFAVSKGMASGPARFLFSSEAGVISGWNSNVPAPGSRRGGGGPPLRRRPSLSLPRRCHRPQPLTDTVITTATTDSTASTSATSSPIGRASRKSPIPTSSTPGVWRSGHPRPPGWPTTAPTSRRSTAARPTRPRHRRSCRSS